MQRDSSNSYRKLLNSRALLYEFFFNVHSLNFSQKKVATRTSVTMNSAKF